MYSIKALNIPKRALAFLLALILTISLLPMTAFADDDIVTSVSMELSAANGYLTSPEQYALGGYGQGTFRLTVTARMGIINDRTLVIRIPKNFTLNPVPTTADISGASSVTAITDSSTKDTVLTVVYDNTGGTIESFFDIQVVQNSEALLAELTDTTVYEFSVEAFAGAASLNTSDAVTLKPAVNLPTLSIYPSMGFSNGGYLTVSETDDNIVFTGSPYRFFDDTYYMQNRNVQLTWSVQKTAGALPEYIDIMLPRSLGNYSYDISSKSNIHATFKSDLGAQIYIWSSAIERYTESNQLVIRILTGDYVNGASTVEIDGKIYTYAELLAGGGTFDINFDFAQDEAILDKLLPDDGKDESGNPLTEDDYLVKPINSMFPTGAAVSAKVLGAAQPSVHAEKAPAFKLSNEGMVTGFDYGQWTLTQLQQGTNGSPQGVPNPPYLRRAGMHSDTYAAYTNLSTKAEFPYEFFPRTITLNTNVGNATYTIKDKNGAYVKEGSITAGTSTSLITDDEIALGYYVAEISTGKVKFTRTNGDISYGDYYANNIVMHGRDADANGNALADRHDATWTITVTADQLDTPVVLSMKTTLIKPQDTVGAVPGAVTTYLNLDSREAVLNATVSKSASTMTYANPYVYIPESDVLKLVDELPMPTSGQTFFIKTNVNDQWQAVTRDDIEAEYRYNGDTYWKIGSWLNKSSSGEDTVWLTGLLTPCLINRYTTGGVALRIEDIYPGHMGYNDLPEATRTQIAESKSVILGGEFYFVSFADDNFAANLTGTTNDPTDTTVFPTDATKTTTNTLKLTLSLGNYYATSKEESVTLKGQSNAMSSSNRNLITLSPVTTSNGNYDSLKTLDYRYLTYDFNYNNETDKDLLGLVTGIDIFPANCNLYLKIYYSTNKSGDNYYVINSYQYPTTGVYAVISKTDAFTAADTLPFDHYLGEVVTDKTHRVEFNLEEDEYITDVKIVVNPNNIIREYYYSPSYLQGMLKQYNLMPSFSLMGVGDGVATTGPVSGDPLTNGQTFKVSAKLSFGDVLNVETAGENYSDAYNIKPENHNHVWTGVAQSTPIEPYPEIALKSNAMMLYGSAPYQGGTLAVTSTINQWISENADKYTGEGFYPTIYYKINPVYTYVNGSLSIDDITMPDGVNVSMERSKTTDGYNVLKVEITEQATPMDLGLTSIKFNLRVALDAAAQNSIVPICETWLDYSVDEAKENIWDGSLLTYPAKTEDTCHVRTDGTLEMVKYTHTYTSQILPASAIGVSAVGVSTDEEGTVVVSKDLQTDASLYDVKGIITGSPSIETTDWIIYIPIPKSGAKVSYTLVREGQSPEYLTSAPSDFSVAMTGPFSVSALDDQGIAYTVSYSTSEIPTINGLPDATGAVSADIGYTDESGITDWSEVTMLKLEIPSIDKKVQAAFELPFVLAERKTVLGIQHAYASIYFNFKTNDDWYYTTAHTTGKTMAANQLITYRLEDFYVTGQIWNDVNYNSLLDTAERNGGVSGTNLQITASGSTKVIDSATTGAAGNYSLSVPSYGTYTVKATAPSGYIPVIDRIAGGTDATFSWFGQSSGTMEVAFTTKNITNRNGGFSLSPSLDNLPDMITISEGKTAEILPKVIPNYYTPSVSYSSSNSKIASVADLDSEANGYKAEITAHQAGAVLVTVTIPDGYGGTVEKSIVVRVIETIATVASAADLHFYVGDSYALDRFTKSADFSIVANSVIGVSDLTFDDSSFAIEKNDGGANLSTAGGTLQENQIGKYTLTYTYAGDTTTDSFTITRNIYVHGKPFLTTDKVTEVEAAQSRAGHAFDPFTTAAGDDICGFYMHVSEDGSVAGASISSDDIKVISYQEVLDDDSLGTPQTTEPSKVGRFIVTYQLTMPCGGTYNIDRYLYEQGNPKITIKTGAVWPSYQAKTAAPTVAEEAELVKTMTADLIDVLTIESSGSPFYSLVHVKADGTKVTYTNDDIEKLIKIGAIELTESVDWTKAGIYPISIHLIDKSDLGDGLDMNALGLYNETDKFGCSHITAYIQITESGAPTLSVGSSISKLADQTGVLVTVNELMKDVSSTASDGKTDLSSAVKIKSIVKKSETVAGSDNAVYDGTGGLSDDDVKDIFSNRGVYTVTYSVTEGSGGASKTVELTREIFVHGTPEFFNNGSLSSATNYEMVLESDTLYTPVAPDCSIVLANGVRTSLTLTSSVPTGADISDISKGIVSVAYTANTFAATGISKEYSFTKYLYISTPVKIEGIDDKYSYPINTDVDVKKGTDSSGNGYDVKATLVKTKFDIAKVGTYLGVETVNLTSSMSITLQSGARVTTLNESAPSIVSVTYIAEESGLPLDQQYKNAATNRDELTVNFAFYQLPVIELGANVVSENEVNTISVKANANADEIAAAIAATAWTIYPGDTGKTTLTPNVVGPNTNADGKPYVTVTAVDKDGNESKTDVLVDYQQAPVISDNGDLLFTAVSDFDPTSSELRELLLDGISVTDHTKDDGIGNVADVKITEPSDSNWYKTPGTYEITYYYTDSKGQKATHTRIVRVDGDITWIGGNLSYTIGDASTPTVDLALTGVSATQQQAADSIGAAPTSIDISGITVKTIFLKNGEINSTVSETYMSSNPGHYEVTYQYYDGRAGVYREYTRNIVMSGMPVLSAGDISVKTNTVLDADKFITLIDGAASADRVLNVSAPETQRTNLTSNITVKSVNGNTVSGNLQELLNAITNTSTQNANGYSVELEVTNTYEDTNGNTVTNSATKTILVKVTSDAAGVLVTGRDWHIVEGDTLTADILWQGASATNVISGTTMTKSVKVYSDAARTDEIKLEDAIKKQGVYYLKYEATIAGNGLISATDCDISCKLLVDGSVMITGNDEARFLESTTPYNIADSGVTAQYTKYDGTVVTVTPFIGIGYYPLLPGGQDIVFKAVHPTLLSDGVTAGTGRSAEFEQQVYVDGLIVISGVSDKEDNEINTDISVAAGVTAEYQKAEKDASGNYILTTVSVTDRIKTSEKGVELNNNILNTDVYGNHTIQYNVDNGVTYRNGKNEAAGIAVFSFPSTVNIVWESADTSTGTVSGGSLSAKANATVAEVAVASPVETYQFEKWTVTGIPSLTVTESLDPTWPGRVVMPQIDGSEIATVKFIAHFTRLPGYNVEFDFGSNGAQTAGDTASATQYVYEGGTATAPLVTSNSGYRFIGWKLENSTDGQVFVKSYIDTLVVLRDLKYVAVYETLPTTANIVWESADTSTGAVSGGPTTIQAGSKIGSTADVTPAKNYVFDRWIVTGIPGLTVTESNDFNWPASLTVPQIDGTPTLAIVFTAYFKSAELFSVVFDAGSNGRFTTTNDPLATQKVYDGQTVTSVPDITAYSNYTFLGWTIPGDSTKYSNEAVAAMPIRANITFTATYQKTTNPVDPTPVDPTPVDPTPVDPTPVDPTPDTYPATLIKVDANDASTTLSGAKFELYRDNASGRDTLVGTYTTDGKGQITVTGLSAGDYYWIETGAPEGYTLDSSRHEFTISSSGTKTITVTNERTGVPDWLNGIDHYAYVIGYPDGNVHPEVNITRAEVATIFFRLLTDEVRDQYSTKVNSFSDVDSADWFCRAVSTMAAMGIVNGYPDGTFGPADNITRAEFAAIAARFDAHGNTSSASFTDIYGHWGEKEINIAANNGWILGYTDGTFKPNQLITRAEAMTMVNRVLQRVPEFPSDLLSNMITWSDNMDTSKWYYLAVQEATNSHDYTRKANGYESWTKLRSVRDWAALEK